jgi:hypothetical protein
MIRVVLIDSSVNAAHPHLAGARIECGPAFDAEGRATLAPLCDHLGHGTAAAAAILDLAPEITLQVVRVFEREPRCTFRALEAALHYSATCEATLVNLSLGTPLASHASACERLVVRLNNAGAALVAPVSFEGLPSFPGVLPSVFGVKEDAALPRAAPVQKDWGGRLLWHASPFPRPLPGLDPARNLRGASMATANLTGFLAKRLVRGEGLPSTPR